MYRILLTFLVAVNACATERPPVLKQFMNNNETGNHVTIVKNLTAEEKAFFWKNTKLDAEGILVKSNPLDRDLTSIDRMLANSTKKVQKSSKLFRHISKNFDVNNIVGELLESEHHINYFIKVSTGIAVINILDLEAEGYKVTIVADFLNAKVRESDATLVLINAVEKSKKRQWTVSWVINNIEYKLSIPDEIQADGKTKLTKNDVIEFATKITPP